MLRTTITSHGGAVRGLHDLRTRKSGADRFVEFHVLVPGEMSVRDAHDETAVLAEKIKERFPGTAVTIHIDPCGLDGLPECVD